MFGLKYDPAILNTPYRCDGTFGRVVLGRSNFYILGGYDETLKGIGYEEIDLILRAVKKGIEYVHILPSVPGIIDESIDPENYYKNKSEEWEKIEGQNRRKSRRHIDAGILNANTNGFKEKLQDYERII